MRPRPPFLPPHLALPFRRARPISAVSWVHGGKERRRVASGMHKITVVGCGILRTSVNFRNEGLAVLRGGGPHFVGLSAKLKYLTVASARDADQRGGMPSHYLLQAASKSPASRSYSRHDSIVFTLDHGFCR